VLLFYKKWLKLQKKDSLAILVSLYAQNILLESSLKLLLMKGRLLLAETEVGQFSRRLRSHMTLQ
jgi:hypothetical protein